MDYGRQHSGGWRLEIVIKLRKRAKEMSIEGKEVRTPGLDHPIVISPVASELDRGRHSAH